MVRRETLAETGPGLNAPRRRVALPMVPSGYQAPTVAVWQLTALRGVSSDAATLLTEKLRAALQKSGWYSVIDRQVMENVMKEQRVELSKACDTTDCAVEYGQYLSASKVAVGTAGRLGTTYQIVLTIVDVQSRKVERIGEGQAAGGEEVLLDLAAAAVADLLRQ